MSELRWVDADDGATLAVRVGGRGIPLVLCHGGPGVWDYFDSLRSDLEDLVTVITWDQRGCGRSASGGPHTAARYVADLECVRAALGVEAWVVGGHSWGATLALFYALAHPQATSGLLYISGTGLGEAWNRVYHDECDRRRQPYQARLDELSGKERSDDEEAEWRRLSWQSDLADPSKLELLEALDRPFRVNLEANAQLNAERKTWSEEDLVHRCRGLDVPALVVHGREDSRPPWAVDSLVEALPRVTSVVLEGVGHLPWLEAPGAFRSTARGFLAEQAGADDSGRGGVAPGP